MSRNRGKAGDDGPKVPGYIVTFSDMVTLLLTFFVMLMTLADFQDPELFNLGRDSFFESIGRFGIGMLMGGFQSRDLGSTKLKYYIENPDDRYQGRTIDANEEEIRRLFNKIRRSARTEQSKLAARKAHFSITEIRFHGDDTTLDEQAKLFLADFALNLQQDPLPGRLRLYVLGLAADQKGPKRQWAVSARRAKAVADFLRARLGPRFRQSVYCWGAGAGGLWAGPDGAVSPQSQILIAVLRPD